MSDPTSLGFHQGDSVSFPVVFKDDQGVVIDLTNATIRSDLRKEYNTAVIASFTVVNTDLVNGSFSLTMDQATSAALPMNNSGRVTSFVFDGQITYVSGAIETFINGYCKVTKEVTQGV